MATINIGNLAFTHKGDYDGSTAYAKNDVVYYSTNGNAYIAKQATTGNAPTNATYWNQFAQGSGGIWNAGLSLGSANQELRVNSGGNALEFHTPSAGGVLQMVHTEITTQPSRSSGNTYADIAGLNLNITPASASNKILVCFNAGIVANDSRTTAFILKRAISGGATTLHGGTAASSRQAAWARCASDSDNNHDYGVTAFYYDSPNTTSQITYTVQWISQGAAYLNRAGGDGDGTEAYQTRTNSRLWAQEIGV